MTPILTGVAPTIPIKKLREQSAKENQKIIDYLQNGNIVKTIYVPNRLINFVVK